jgi:hypothetical protein
VFLPFGNDRLALTALTDSCASCLDRNYPQASSGALVELMTVMAGESGTQSADQSDQISFCDIFLDGGSFSGRKSP